MSYSRHDIESLAPTGVLRSTINLGNPVLARQEAGQSPSGVSVDLAQALAARLGVPLELVVYDGAGKAVKGMESGAADVGFFAIDPLRANVLTFTRPYVLIEGSYLVRQDSSIEGIHEVDKRANRVAVGKGSAYDLYLTRELREAEIVRISTSPAVVDSFVENKYEVAAGVRQQLEADAKRLGGLRVLPGRFMVIEQAMATPKTHGRLAAHLLSEFVEFMKFSGFVLEALRRHNIDGAGVAPPAAWNC